MGISEERVCRAQALVKRAEEVRKKALSMQHTGYSNMQIAVELEISESTVRALLFSK